MKILGEILHSLPLSFFINPAPKNRLTSLRGLVYQVDALTSRFRSRTHASKNIAASQNAQLRKNIP